MGGVTRGRRAWVRPGDTWVGAGTCVKGSGCGLAADG